MSSSSGYELCDVELIATVRSDESDTETFAVVARKWADLVPVQRQEFGDPVTYARDFLGFEIDPRGAQEFIELCNIAAKMYDDRNRGGSA